MGQQVVLDSSNLDAIVKDATGEGLAVPELPLNSGVQTTIDAAKADSKPAADVPIIDAATDDVEGEDGLTPREKRELTDKMQKAIAKRTRALREAEEFAAEQYNTRRLAEAKALQLEQDLAAAKAAQAKPEPAKEAVEPTREQFKTEDDYRDARVDWLVAQRLQAQAEKDAKAAAEKREADILAAAEARMAAAKAAKPDFDELQVPDTVMIPVAVGAYMKESELIGELTYYFKEHTEILDRWCKQLEGIDTRTNEYSRQVSKILVEVGKIESKLQPFAAVTPAKVDDKPNGSVEPSTNGAKPSTETDDSPSPRVSAPVIRPLSTGGASQVEKPASQRSYAEEKVAWQKKHSVNLNRRARH
jgi:hypothetical protein